MTARKKWRIVYPGSSDISFPSEANAYDVVNDMRTRWTTGATLVNKLTVQVDEGLGFGWEYYEHIDFAVEAS